MNEQHVGIAAFPHRKRGAGSDRNRLDRKAGRLLERRYEHVEQSRILSAGRGREDDGRSGRRRQRHESDREREWDGGREGAPEVAKHKRSH